MVEGATLFTGLAALVTAVFALVVLLGNPRRTPNVFLAVFLFLIAGNHTANLLRFLGNPLGVAEIAWYRVASVFSALDPFFLYYFAAVYPERNSLGDHWKVGLVGGVSALLAVSAVFRHPGGGPLESRWIEATWVLFTAVVYTVVLVRLGKRYLSDGRDSPTRLLFYAMLVATFPAWGRVFVWPAVTHGLASLVPGVTSDLGESRGILQFTLVQGSMLLALLGGLWLLRWRPSARDRPRGERRWDTAVVVLAWVLGALIYSITLERLLADFGVNASLETLIFGEGVTFRARYLGGAARWTLFSALTSVAVVRYQLLGLSLKRRRQTARVLVGAGFVLGAGVLVTLVAALGGSRLPEMRAFDVLVLVLVLAASQRFHSLIDRVAETLYGVPMPGDPGASVQTYREAVREAAEEGRRPDRDPELARLAEELGLDDDTVRALHATARDTHSREIGVGETVQGRYSVTRLLHRGTTGRVYLGHDEVLDREVVLKVIPRTDDRAEAGLEEARLAGGLDHANVVTVYDVLELADADVLVTEHVAGGDLEAWLEDHGPLTAETAVELLDGILAGVAAVHDAGVVHRDLKPSNVLVAADGTPKVADLGVARVRQGATRTLADADEVAGTPTWMAPEQLDGKVATERSDVYAAGRLLEALVDGALPARLAEVHAQATADDPRDRYASAGAMRRALQQAGSGD